MDGYKAYIIGIGRHRLTTDGDGVTTLVAFHGCPLRCQYCLNPQSLGKATQFQTYTPESLYQEVKIDELYFIATGGGVTFGGGEPALRPEFIRHFRELCGPTWKITLETSLNVPEDNIKALLPVVDFWIIDIKDMDAAIYNSYTGTDNTSVLSNLRLIAEAGRQGDCIIRLPLIPGYNDDAARDESRKMLTNMGFEKFDLFTYIIRKH